MKPLPSYIFAACITALATAVDLSAGFNPVSVGIFLLLAVPLLLPVTAHTRTRSILSVSFIFTGIATFYVATAGIAFARAESLSDFEGSNGEGAPIAPVFGLAVFTLLFLIPWVLVVMRSLKSVKEEK